MRNSILNDTKYFHVAVGLPIDIMHDVLEGSLHLCLKLLLKYLIYTSHFFSLKTLNSRITTFSFGNSDSRNKPSLINDSTFSSTDGSHFAQSGELKQI